MEVNISTRNLEVSDRFRDYVSERAQKVEHLAQRVESLNIKVTRHDHNRNSGPEDQVELTVFEPGHVIRAEAQAAEKFAAFDMAFDKLIERLRRASDRAKVHRGLHKPPSINEMTAGGFSELDVKPVYAGILINPEQRVMKEPQEAQPDFGDSPVVIRRKEFAGNSMSVDDALYHMELVGHDFYLFLDEETGKPSVVYRRKGWNYGVITLS